MLHVLALRDVRAAIPTLAINRPLVTRTKSPRRMFPAGREVTTRLPHAPLFSCKYGRDGGYGLRCAQRAENGRLRKRHFVKNVRSVLILRGLRERRVFECDTMRTMNEGLRQQQALVAKRLGWQDWLVVPSCEIRLIKPLR